MARVGRVRREPRGRQLRRVELGERGQTGSGLVPGSASRSPGQTPGPGRHVRLPELFRRPVRGDHAAFERHVLPEAPERRPTRGRDHDPTGIRGTRRDHRRPLNVRSGSTVSPLLPRPYPSWNRLLARDPFSTPTPPPAPHNETLGPFAPSQCDFPYITPHRIVSVSQNRHIFLSSYPPYIIHMNRNHIYELPLPHGVTSPSGRYENCGISGTRITGGRRIFWIPSSVIFFFFFSITLNRCDMLLETR